MSQASRSSPPASRMVSVRIQRISDSRCMAVPLCGGFLTGTRRIAPGSRSDCGAAAAREALDRRGGPLCFADHPAKEAPA
jgi:hypothetical protein